MPDLERKAVTRYGLSFSEFWNSTPRELDMLMEQHIYQEQQEWDRVRHVMATMMNTVVDRKKRPEGFKPKDILKLPMIDGYMTKEERDKKQAEAEQALIRAKELWMKPKKEE